MNNKIFIYLFYTKIKFILLNILFIGLFVQLINLLEISRIIENENSSIFLILYLSLLKLPSIIIDTIPFVIIISTAFLYKNLISNNEIISMRNVGFSILDIYKPIAAAIFIVGLIILLIINPISAKFEKYFDLITEKDFSNMYSINIKNNELWIKNIKDDETKYFINIAKVDLDKMYAEDIKIISINNDIYYLYLAKDGKLFDYNFNLNNVVIFDINNDKYNKKEKIQLDLNFNNNNLLDSISNYKFIPYYKYKEHLKSLKKFNLYSHEIALYYLSEILKPLFLVIIGFTVMSFSGKFKRNENFFKVLFISILIGFLLFLLKELVTTITIATNISFWLAYLIILMVPLIVGLYQTINIETN